MKKFMKNTNRDTNTDMQISNETNEHTNTDWKTSNEVSEYTNVKNNNNALAMKNDIMFKAFFSKEGHKAFLEEFVGAILKKKVKINQIIHDARLEQTSKEEKYGILDLDVELESGEKVNLEMQLKNWGNIKPRTSFYASKKISEQIGIGKYYENIRQVIIIAILDYSFIPYDDYVTETVTVAKNHREYELNNEVKYYYIELAKFRKQNPDMKEKLNQWLAFLDRERGDLLEMAKKENKMISKADDEYHVLTGDAELKRLAEIRLMSALEEHSALLTAKNEGKAEGKKEGEAIGEKRGKKLGRTEGEAIGEQRGAQNQKIEIARQMLKENLEIDLIVRLTGLTKEEIKELGEK
jgi:predicted transposase/invertase (TIGR01784 family)